MTLKEAALQLTAALGEPRTRNVNAYLAELAADHGASERLRELDFYERYYLGTQHDEKVADWDGRPYQRKGQCGPMATIATALQKPIYRKASWRLRRPFVRKQGAKTIVNRFTGLLFGEKRIPRIVPVDPACGPFIAALLKETEWWGQWSLARTYGGAEGSVAVGMQLYEGQILVEVVNAKWCTPRWLHDNPASGRLAAIEIRCIRPVTRIVAFRDPQTGATTERLTTVLEQYLRIVDKDIDVVLTAPEKARDGDWRIESKVVHRLGECPFVWVQNTRVVGDIDGAPDCDQQWDNLDAIDALLSGMFVGTAQNAEPSSYVKLDNRDAGEITMGSGSTTLVLKSTEDAGYIESAGTGGEAAEKRARAIWDGILEDVHCVIDEGQGAAGARTATELQKRTEAMFERADEFRRQYGDAMERSFEMLLRLLRAYNYEGLPASLPLDCKPTVDDVTVEWPPYVQMTPADKTAEIGVYKTANEAGFISRVTSVAKVAHLLGVEDIEAERALLAAEAKEKAALYETMLGNPPVRTQDDPPKDEDDDEPPEPPEKDDAPPAGE